MAHIQARRYLGGWWPAGPKEEAPDGTLRRNRGVRRFMEGHIRSRLGTSLIKPINAHSIVRFRDQRYYGVETTFMREDTVIRTGLALYPLRFARMPTTDGKEDSLFVTSTGAGSMFRVDPSGAVMDWGITAPPDGFTASVASLAQPADTMTAADAGAGVLNGTYAYRVAFFDTAGALGPMNPTPVTTGAIAARKITLSGIPVGPAGSNVAKRLLLRTRGNQSGYHHLAQLANNTTTTFTDNVPDGSLVWDLAENLQGTYQYRVTFKNTDSGSRSNGNPTPVTIMGAQQGALEVTLSNLPVSTQAGVNAREIWRTVGNGNVFFLAGIINDNTTRTYVDRLPDVSLEEEELPDDNNSPSGEFVLEGVTGPHSTRLWWHSRLPGDRGKVYYSPPARPEGVEDFIFVSNDDDPVQTMVVWGPSLFVFTEARVYEVIGDGPFVARDIPEAPGTVQWRTVVPTPFGILYLAHDGVRICNGQNSRVIAFDAVSPLFHGESLEGVAAFKGELAVYYQGEYLISDLKETLGLDIARGVWRVLGLACWAFYAEPDTGMLLAMVTVTPATAGEVHALEAETMTSDNWRSFRFEVEWPHVLVGVVYPGVLQFLNILIDTSNQPLTPTLILDGVERTLPTLTTSGRTRVEWPIGRSCRMAGLRLTGYLTQPVTIWAVDGEFYAGAPDASVTAGAATR